MDRQVILVVEDEPDIREGIRILLGGEGYISLEAGSGEEALSMLNEAVAITSSVMGIIRHRRVLSSMAYRNQKKNKPRK